MSNGRKPKQVNGRFASIERPPVAACRLTEAPGLHIDLSPSHCLRELDRRRKMADDYTRKRLLAIDVLLEEPEEISDGLEAELYALRDTLHLKALGRIIPGNER